MRSEKTICDVKDKTETNILNSFRELFRPLSLKRWKTATHINTEVVHLEHMAYYWWQLHYHRHMVSMVFFCSIYRGPPTDWSLGGTFLRDTLPRTVCLSRDVDSCRLALCPKWAQRRLAVRCLTLRKICKLHCPSSMHSLRQPYVACHMSLNIYRKLHI